jgi:rhodanese-related sulfurtransferase
MQSLSATDLAALVASPDESPPVLLDVREPWETAHASIHGVRVAPLNIPMMQIPARLADIDRTRSVVCMCHHGMRSAQVVAFLVQQGYPSVYNLSGGIDAWSRDVDASVPRY